MNETNILQRVRLAASKLPGVKLFRNQVGGLKDHSGRLVTFGLHPGSADLIGWKSVEITADMVGRRVAVFVSVEVKTATGAVRPEQINWQNQIDAAGGIAEIIRSETEAVRILK
jgi:hypothetical protein